MATGAGGRDCAPGPRARTKYWTAVVARRDSNDARLEALGLSLCEPKGRALGRARPLRWRASAGGVVKTVQDVAVKVVGSDAPGALSAVFEAIGGGDGDVTTVAMASRENGRLELDLTIRCPKAVDIEKLSQAILRLEAVSLVQYTAPAGGGTFAKPVGRRWRF